MPSPGLCSLRSEGKNPRSASRSRPAGREIPRSAALSVRHFFPKIFKVQKVITPENLRSASRSRPAGREMPRSAGLSVGGHFFQKIFKVQKKKKKKVTYTLPPFESSRRDRHFYRISRTRSEWDLVLAFFFLFFRSCNFYAQNVHRCLLDALWKFRPDPSTRCGSKSKRPPPGTSFCHFSSFLASFGRGKDFLAILWQFPTERNRDLFDIARLPDSTRRPQKKRAHVLTGLDSFTPFERLGDEFARPSTGFDGSRRATGLVQVPFDAHFDAESDSATIFHKCRKGGKWHAKKPIFPPLKCPGPKLPSIEIRTGAVIVDGPLVILHSPQGRLWCQEQEWLSSHGSPPLTC